LAHAFSFCLSAIATFVSNSRTGTGEGTAPLQTRVSRPKSFTLHNDEFSDWQKAKKPTYSAPEARFGRSDPAQWESETCEVVP
jgi:hypothetical protein